MAWAVSYEGHEWRPDDLRVRDIDKIVELSERSWMQIEMDPFHSPRSLAAILAVCIASTDPDVKVDKKFEEFLDFRARDLVAVIVEAKDDMPDMYEDGLPKAEGETSTSTESGAQNGTGGRRPSPRSKRSATSASS